MKRISFIKIIFVFCILISIGFKLNAQELIDVTDQTIKIGGLKEEEIYFGFAEGDKITFNFKEINGKELKELEIIQYPNNSKFSEYKTSKVENKSLLVAKTGVYIFRFKNSAITGRICKIQIQRMPSNELLKNFNTTVTWISKQDTTWNTYTKDVIIAYDTTYQQKTKIELVSSEQKEELIMDKSQRVHSTSNANGNKTSLFFTLPKNEKGNYVTKKVIAWAYWVGVGDEANQAWKSNMKTVSNLAKGVATLYTTPLGALAVGAVTDLMIPKVGENVYYAITDQTNKDLFIAGIDFVVSDQGNGIAGYKKFVDSRLCQGTYFICLSNDNMMQGIDANVKVVAIIETNKYEDKAYTEMTVTPKYEKKMFSDPIIKTSRIPVTIK